MNNKKLNFRALILSLLNISICHTCSSLKDNFAENTLNSPCDIIYNNDAIGSTKIPRVTLITDNILEIFTQYGTGLGASRCVYYDINKEQLSETFTYVITNFKERVVYADCSNGSHKIIVRDIFDKNLYLEEYDLQDCYGSDFIVDFKFNSPEELVVEYLASEDCCSTKSITINL